ncbi:MAG: aldehyde dehydrogenase [Saprospiraceae bacterium]|nr:aldehyde dehydrogenase [Saprospiraceae bacterium]
MPNHVIKMLEIYSFPIRQPIGVVGCLIPWNMPLYQLCRKVAPALATGNCVIAKPSQWSPMSAYLLAQACEEAGLPKGVLNILQGKDYLLQELIVEHPKIKAITYTGDASTGRKIVESAARQLKKCAINIGGNNATIILQIAILINDDWYASFFFF